MHMLQAGVAPEVIALWLGHERQRVGGIFAYEVKRAIHFGNVWLCSTSDFNLLWCVTVNNQHLNHRHNQD
jgi:hypothetical protein